MIVHICVDGVRNNCFGHILKVPSVDVHKVLERNCTLSVSVNLRSLVNLYKEGYIPNSPGHEKFRLCFLGEMAAALIVGFCHNL